MTDLTAIIAQAKSKFDLTDPADQQTLYPLAEALLAFTTANGTEAMETAAQTADAPLEFKIAAKLVHSRRFMERVDRPLNLAVVFAMWGEQNRLRPRSADNPNGEDLLRIKVEQLTWATQNTPVEWTLYAVDDGCPYDSGRIAKEMIQPHPAKDKVKVLFLADGISAKTGPLRELNSVNDSRKGGAIIYGCQQAIEDGADAVIYTDADNSVHLGQIGLLLQPYVDDQKRVVLGNRKHPQAVLVKQESRWGIGIKLLRHMQRMIGRAIFSEGIRDSQAAFKLYDRHVLQKIIETPSVFDFSFDTDWIAAVLAMEEPYVTVPFAFVDSFAESASIVQGPMTTWETLLKGLATAVRKRGISHNEAMARVLDEEIHSSEDLDLLINHLPPALEQATDQDFGDPAVMSPEAVQEWIQFRKAEASR